MKTRFNSISLYWKCQLLGWAVFTIVAYVFDISIFKDYIKWIPFAVSIFILGSLDYLGIENQQEIINIIQL